MGQSTAAPARSRWQAVGGREGGTITALALAPRLDKDHLVFAASLAGLHRSTDGGATWASASAGLRSPFIEAVTVSPTFDSDRTVFVGTRNAGLWVSTDAGETWMEQQFWGARQSITAVVASPSYAQDGIIFAGSEGAGVFRSDNRGKSFSACNFGVADLVVVGVAVSPAFKTDQTAFLATPAGVYRSPNAGRAWRESSVGLEDVAIQCLAISPAFDKDRTLYLGTEEQGVYVSTDRGSRWKPISAGLDDLCVTCLTVSPRFAEDRTLLAGTASGVYRSRDAGATWQKTAGDPIAVLALALDEHGSALAGCANHGVFRSADAGATWSSTSHGLFARLLVGLVVSPNFANDSTLFSTSLDEGVARSRDSGATWQTVNDGLGSPQVPALAISPAFAADSTLFAGTSTGLARSQSAGESWTPTAGLQGVEIRTLAVSPRYATDGTILAGLAEGKVFVSCDRGETFTPMATPASADEVVWVGFSSTYERDQTVFVGTSREARGEEEGMISVWRSTDGGQIWNHFLGQNTASRWVAVAVPPGYADTHTLFVGIDNQVFRPPLSFETGTRTRKRQIWAAERVAKPTQALVALVPSPSFARDRTLYAASSDGVYRSTTGALSWRPIADGLTVRSTVALAVAPTADDGQSVFAATLGGMIWKLVTSD